MAVKPCLHIKSPRPCLSKFNIVSMLKVVVSLMGGVGLEPYVTELWESSENRYQNVFI